jgi:hypothetical protein
MGYREAFDASEAVWELGGIVRIVSFRFGGRRGMDQGWMVD